MKYLKLFLGAALLAGTAACSEKEGNGKGEIPTLTDPVKFNSEIVSMNPSAQSDTWAEGAQVGIYMFQHGTNHIVGEASNAEYKASVSGSLAAAGSEIRYSSKISTADFFAYYPYRAQVDNYTLPIDLSVQTDPLATCLLYSNNASEITAQTEAVKLQFTHKLSKLSFVIKPGAGVTTADLSGLTMSIEGFDTKADFNALTGRITNRQQPATTAAIVATDGKSAQFVTFPGTELSFKVLFKLKNNLTFDYQTDKTFTLEQGKIQTMNVSIGSSAVELTPGGIAEWEGIDTPPTTGSGTEITPTKAYAVGDAYPDDSAPVGIIFEVNSDGTHGKVVGLVEAAKRWGAFPKLEAGDGITDAAEVDNGREITTQLIAMRYTAGNFISDYGIFHWLYATVNGSDTEGAWYIPAKNEMRALLAATSGLIYTDIAAAWTDETTMPGFAETENARTAFNEKITAAAGTILNPYGVNWCSTEFSAEQAWCVNFNTGGMDKKEKYDQWGPTVRPIMAF